MSDPKAGDHVRWMAGKRMASGIVQHIRQARGSSSGPRVIILPDTKRRGAGLACVKPEKIIEVLS